MFELEVKYAVSDPEGYREQVERRFKTAFGAVQEERDLFFQHVNRDFRLTDECLRLRSVDSRTVMTYKGPKLDTQTKTREEIELPLARIDGMPGATVDAWRTLLERLGFRAVAEVVKFRRSLEMEYEATRYSITLDELPRLGSFTEWETMAGKREEIAAKRDRLVALAGEMNLKTSIRKSYLELLQEQNLGK